MIIVRLLAHGIVANCTQPPNAAKHGCHIFDEATGRSNHVKQGHFYSELGIKIE